MNASSLLWVAGRPRARQTILATAVASAFFALSLNSHAQYVAVNSTGPAAVASGTDSVAVGPAATAAGSDSTAIGKKAVVVPSVDTGSVALGYGAMIAPANATSSSGNLAIGMNAIVGGSVAGDLTNAIAIGTGAQSERSNGIAIGASSHNSSAGVAIGNNASTGIDGQIAIGTNAVADPSSIGTPGGIAIGQGSYTGGVGAAVGVNAHASGESVAAGANAYAGYRNVVVGAQATATGNQSVAVGFGSNDSGRAQVVSVGGNGITRAITNVTAGTTTTDAANVGQLPGTISGSVVTMGNALAPSASSGAVTVTNVAAGRLTSTSTDAVNGSQLYTTNQNVASNTTAINTLSSGLNAGTVGLVQQVGGAPGSGAITVGAATGGTTVDFTGTSGARQLNGVAAGVAATDAVNVSQLNAVGGIAANSVQYDDATRAHVTLGGTAATAPVGLSNIAAGNVSASSTDAVNGSQLYATNQAVAGNTTAISSLSTGLNNGTVGLVQQVGGAPGNGTITVGVSTGGTAVDFTGTSGARQLKGVAAGTDATDAVNVSQLTATVNSATANAVMYDNAARSSVTLGGVGATAQVLLTNVAAGTLSATSTDAVNGSQLYATNLAVTANTNAINALSSSLSGVQHALTTIPTAGQAATVPEDLKYFAATSTGSAASASGSESVAAGGNALASGSNSAAVGSGAQASGKGAVALGAGASATAGNSVALGQGSVASTDNAVSIGNSSTGLTRTLANVSAGVAPTDAVNVQQLNDSVRGLRSQIEHDRADANGGTATAVAIASLPQAPAPGKSVVSVGGGTYAGQSAIAVGVSTYAGRWILKASGSTNTRGTVGAGIGAGYVW